MSLLRTAAAAVAIACALPLGGCLGGGDDESSSSRVRGDELTVYSSLPRGGISRDVARAIAAGQRRALADAGGRAGDYDVKLVELDSTEAGEPLWDPDRVDANAERATDDPTTIAYLGEVDYGGTAVSLPITNDAGILQVSPTDGLTSLTREPPGRPRAGPDRYYPSGQRTFLRLVPNDLLLSETLLGGLREDGDERLAVLFGTDIYGRELGAQVVARARRDGPEPVVTGELPETLDEIPDLARELGEAAPDAVVYAGVAGPLMAPMLAAIDRRLPGVPVYGAAGLLARSPARPIPAAPESVTALSPVAPAATLRGRRLLREIAREEGADAALPQALYGYESMRAVLDAIEVGGGDRAAVARAALAIGPRESVIGRYEVRGTGDVGAENFASYRLDDGRFAFDGMVR